LQLLDSENTEPIKLGELEGQLLELEAVRSWKHRAY